MPIYEYRCEQGHTFEVMQRMTEDPVVSCHTCSAPVSRVFHPIAVHFKGSGFYATDYGSRKRSRELKDAAEGTGAHAKEDGASKSKSGDSGSGDSSSGDSGSADKNEKRSKSESAATSAKTSD
jgi:putative FmdB family regulatory protein